MIELPSTIESLNGILTRPIGSVVSTIAILENAQAVKQTAGGAWSMTLFIMDESIRRSLRFSILARDRNALPVVDGAGDILVLRRVKLESFRDQPYLNAVLFDQPTSVVVCPAGSLPGRGFLESYMGGKQQLASRGLETARKEITLREIEYIIELNASSRGRALQLTPGKSINLKSQINPPVLESGNGDEDRTTSNGTSKPTTPTGPRSSTLSSVVNRPPGIIGTRDGQMIDRYQPQDRRPTDYEQAKLQSSISRGKLKLISQIAFSSGYTSAYADICVEVLRKFDGQYRFELLVTDYTEHDGLYDRLPPELAHTGFSARSQDEWTGPYGRRVLKVVLASPHKEFAQQHLSAGDLVLLQNVKMKPDNHGNLQGDIWPDRDFPHKVAVQKLLHKDTSTIRDLLHRKSTYLESRRPLEAPISDQTGAPSDEHKREKRRMKKQRQKERGEIAAEARNNANKHLRCSDPGKPLTSVREILDADDRRHTNQLPGGVIYKLPFMNNKFRTKVKVVDFYPDIEDFARPAAPSQHSFQSDESTGYKWSFTLMLQDADTNDKITAHVGHLQAQYLLGADMPNPQDLRKSSTLLAKLRSRLDILWGDLEERRRTKTEGLPSNKPFECCISEYGTLTEGGRMEDISAWKRCYMMHGVTII